MPSIAVQRRQFLRALGAGAMALPFYRLLEPSVVQGQSAARPMRLLLLYTGYGGVWDYLRPAGVAVKDGTEAALTAQSLTFENSVLEPLKNFASKMLVLEGMGMNAGLIPLDPQKPIESRTNLIGHDHSAPNCFTGSPVTDVGDNISHDSLPKSPSIDYVLAQKFGGDTAVRHLPLGIGVDPSVTYYDSLSYNDAGQRIPGLSDPGAVFRQLFGSTAGSSAPPPAAGDTAAERKAKRNKSVMNAINASAQRLRGKLAGTERAKLDEHLAALADIESGLSATSGGTTAPPPPVSCGTPTAPSGGSDLPALTKSHFDIIAQAFACDRTRFINTAWGVNVNQPTWLFGRDVEDLHNEVAHVIDAAGEQGATAKVRMAKLNNWYAGRIAELMQRLESTPDGDGTVLDNTLIVWVQDFGMQVHGGLNTPYILLGGAQNKFKMGRYLNLRTGKNPTDQYRDVDSSTYRPNNHLLVSMMNAFGVEGDTFGSTEFKGSLNGIL